jgi:cytoskeletal protein CcmA (bactofilin family)
MFNNNNSERADGTSLIGEGLTIEGDLSCKGEIEIAGIMNGNIRAESLKVLETGSVIGGVKASKFEVFGFIEGEIYADDIVIGKTAIIKGDIFFKENLKIDEGADVDGYIKRVNQNKQASKPQQSQKAKVKEEKKEKQLEIEDTEKKAVNQS